MHLYSYLQKGMFPPKPVWKNIVNQSISNDSLAARADRMNSDPDFTLFRCVIEGWKPGALWAITTNSQEILLCKFIGKFLDLSIYLLKYVQSTNEISQMYSNTLLSPVQ